jgi:filamentous hemagglutinin
MSNLALSSTERPLESFGAKASGSKGIGEGDTGWEKYNASQNPNAKLLPPRSTGFDLFEDTTGEAISAKTLDTKTMTYIRKPQEIYKKVQRYVGDVLDYGPCKDTDLDPAAIQSKTIQLAIPEHTSPEQWRYLLRAIVYGKDNGVKIVITRIR